MHSFMELMTRVRETMTDHVVSSPNVEVVTTTTSTTTSKGRRQRDGVVVDNDVVDVRKTDDEDEDEDGASVSSSSYCVRRLGRASTLEASVLHKLLPVSDDDDEEEDEEEEPSHGMGAPMTNENKMDRRFNKKRVKKMIRKSARRRKKLEKTSRKEKCRVLERHLSRATLPTETVNALVSNRDGDAKIIDGKHAMEVNVYDVETLGVYKTKHKKTYVQVAWKRKLTRRKVSTSRREDTDNPIWAEGKGKFIFQNCSPDGYFNIKLKEVRMFRKVVVGYASIPAKLIPHDGTKAHMRIFLDKKSGSTRRDAGAIVRLSIGRTIFKEPAVGEKGYWPSISTEADACRQNRPKLLVVSVMNARGLYDADSMGSSDPYVKLGFNTTPLGERYRTACKYQTRFPVWNERYLLRVPEDPECSAVVFTLWDKDTFSTHDFLGSAAISLDEIPLDGQVADVDLDIKGRITPDAAGEVCWIHPRAPSDLGKLRVQISEVDEAESEAILKTLRVGRLTRGEGTALARSVHVAVVAARQLFHIDNSNGSCDAFAYVSIDNAPKDEFCRTKTIFNTLHPVWNNGIGQVFTLIARPGAAEVWIELYDRNLFSSTLMGKAAISLASLPPDGSWKEFATPLYGTDENRNALVGSTDGGLAWNAPERVKGELVVRLSAARFPHANIPQPPPVLDSMRYINQHETNKYLYVQALGFEGLPIRYKKDSTNAQIRVSLNTHRDILCSRIQRGVMEDFDFTPEVMAMPKTHLSRTLTIQVISQMKSIYGSRTAVKLGKKFISYFGLPELTNGNGNKASEGAQGDEVADPIDDEDEDENYGYVEGEERFTNGNAIGYAQIRVDDLRVGDLKKFKVKLLPMHKTKSWLSSRSENLGEMEVMLGCGYAKFPPKNLLQIDQAARPTLGSFTCNIASVIGDRTPNQHLAPVLDNLLNMASGSAEKFGKHVWASVMWDNRSETVKSTREYFKFSITEAASDIRIVFKCRDILTGGDHILGAVSIPISTVLESPGRKIDSWFNITPPSSEFLTEEEMEDPNHAMCVYPRSKGSISDWQGFARINLSFESKGSNWSEWAWYLQQTTSPQKTNHIPDTIDGVILSLHRLVESIVFPIKMFARAAIFMYNHPLRARVKVFWFSYHTLCCLTFRRAMLSSFILIWLLPGLFVCGYCSRFITSDMLAHLPLFQDDEANASALEKTRREVIELGKTRNRKLRKYRDKFLEEEKLAKLRARGRAVELTEKAVKQGVRARKARRQRAGIDDELPSVSSMLLPQNWINGLVAVLTSANPADMVLSLIQRIVWRLLKIIKDAGTTLVRIDRVVTSGGPRLMPGVCKLAGTQLESIADSLDRPVQLITWNHPALSKYFCTLAVMLTIVACCCLLVVEKIFSLVNTYCPIRLWHLVWLIGVAPTLPVMAVHLKRVAVGVEYALQLIVGMYVPVMPVCLETIEEVKKLLDADLQDKAKVLKDQVRKELEAKRLQREALKERRAREAQERFKRRHQNPLQWIGAAVVRAPTSSSVLHNERTMRFSRPGHEDAPSVDIFRSNIQFGSATVHIFSSLIAFAMAVPIRAVNMPLRVIQRSTERRLDAWDRLNRIRTMNWLMYEFTLRKNLPFGSVKVDVKAADGGDAEAKSPMRNRVVEVDDETAIVTAKSATKSMLEHNTRENT